MQFGARVTYTQNQEGEAQGVFAYRAQLLLFWDFRPFRRIMAKAVGDHSESWAVFPGFQIKLAKLKFTNKTQHVLCKP